MKGNVGMRESMNEKSKKKGFEGFWEKSMKKKSNEKERKKRV